MIENDGDIIRGLGFVTLYSAYLEEQIDNLLEMLNTIEAYDSKKQRWKISIKIKHAKEIIDRLDGDGISEFGADLITSLELFEERNEVVHGRIYGGFDRPDTLKSGRSNVPDRNIFPEELYDLANEFHEFSNAIYAAMVFKLPRVIGKYSTHG
jgi:hypothetical protein